MAHDHLYAKSQSVVEAFKFDEKVAAVFTDMIRRSVPGYTLMLDLLGVLAEKTVTDNSHCYDLGCSLGASTLAIRQNIQANNCHIFALDTSEAMIQSCQSVIQKDTSPTKVSVAQQDILNTQFSNISLCSLNLTLQFIAPEERLPLLRNIAQNTLTGGALFLSEKVVFNNSQSQHYLTDLHHQFKKHQGYSDLEVAQKRSAIENVLIPETIECHKKRLLEAGFSHVVVALQAFNFVSFIAYK